MQIPDHDGIVIFKLNVPFDRCKAIDVHNDAARRLIIGVFFLCLALRFGRRGLRRRRRGRLGRRFRLCGGLFRIVFTRRAAGLCIRYVGENKRQDARQPQTRNALPRQAASVDNSGFVHVVSGAHEILILADSRVGAGQSDR